MERTHLPPNCPHVLAVPARTPCGPPLGPQVTGLSERTGHARSRCSAGLCGAALRPGAAASGRRPWVFSAGRTHFPSPWRSRALQGSRVPLHHPEGLATCSCRPPTGHPGPGPCSRWGTASLHWGESPTWWLSPVTASPRQAAALRTTRGFPSPHCTPCHSDPGPSVGQAEDRGLRKDESLLPENGASGERIQRREEGWEGQRTRERETEREAERGEKKR